MMTFMIVTTTATGATMITVVGWWQRRHGAKWIFNLPREREMLARRRMHSNDERQNASNFPEPAGARCASKRLWSTSDEERRETVTFASIQESPRNVHERVVPSCVISSRLPGSLFAGAASCHF
jgi:hypothetical protein